MAVDKVSDHYVTVNGITLHYVRRHRHVNLDRACEDVERP